MSDRSALRDHVLLGLGFALMMAALYLVFVYVPTEKVMGIVQRIFYLMVPSAWLALLSFLIVFVGSILYLAKGEEKWDILAHSSARIGVVFTSLALLVGALWAKPAWGVWWTWEPRLTSTLVLWLIYLAYLLVRSFAGEGSGGARFAAVVGIVGFLDIPVIVLSTTLWRGMHPGGLIFEGGLAPSMLLTLQVGIVAFTVLYVLLLVQSVSVSRADRELRRLRHSRTE